MIDLTIKFCITIFSKLELFDVASEYNSVYY